MIEVASLTPGRSCCVVELATYDVEITPSTFAPLAAAARRNSRFAETLLMNVMVGVQPTFVAVTSAVMVGSRRREDDERVGALALQREDLLREARIGDVVRLGVDDVRLLGAEADPQSGVVVLAVRVVLVEHADLRVGRVGVDVLAVGLRLTRIVGLPPGRPRVLLRGEAPVGVAGGEQDLRDLLLVQRSPRREAGRGAQAAVDREDVVCSTSCCTSGTVFDGSYESSRIVKSIFRPLTPPWSLT